MCRAYLSPWKDPETGEYVTIGRANIGAVSLNLPLIWLVAEYEHPEAVEEHFYRLLDKNLLMIRNFLKRRYDVIRETPCSTNPLAFTQGGLYKGHKKPDEKIGDLVNYMTASFGVTALNELCQFAKKHSIHESNQFAVDVVQYIYDRVQEFKKEDGYLYALYGTPSESLAGTQAEQIRKYLESIGRKEEAYNFPTYVTNSFHCHVSENITPFEKQDHEFKLFHMIEGKTF